MGMAKIEGDEVVVRIPLTTLAHESTIPESLLDDMAEPRFRVTNARKFAAEFVRELNAEAEDGTTPVHVMLDAAYLAAVENGAEGIEETGHD